MKCVSSFLLPGVGVNAVGGARLLFCLLECSRFPSFCLRVFPVAYSIFVRLIPLLRLGAIRSVLFLGLLWS